MIVQRFINDTREDVTEAPATAAIPTTIGMVPGFYLFSGRGFDCRPLGLYRFWAGNGSKVINTRIVHGGDVYAFMSAVSWHHVHGLADELSATVPPYTDGVYWTARWQSGKTSKWEMRCGYVATMARWWIPGNLFLQARVVNLTTLGPLNGVDDGHVVIEVNHQGKWKLWDLTNGLYFTLGGVHLSAAEIIAAGVGNCQIVRIGSHDKLNSVTPASGFDLGAYFDMVLKTPADLDLWLARIYQSWAVAA